MSGNEARANCKRLLGTDTTTDPTLAVASGSSLQNCRKSPKPCSQRIQSRASGRGVPSHPGSPTGMRFRKPGCCQRHSRSRQPASHWPRSKWMNPMARCASVLFGWVARNSWQRRMASSQWRAWRSASTRLKSKRGKGPAKASAWSKRCRPAESCPIFRACFASAYFASALARRSA